MNLHLPSPFIMGRVGSIPSTPQPLCLDGQWRLWRQDAFNHLEEGPAEGAAAQAFPEGCPAVWARSASRSSLYCSCTSNVRPVPAALSSQDGKASVFKVLCRAQQPLLCMGITGMGTACRRGQTDSGGTHRETTGTGHSQRQEQDLAFSCKCLLVCTAFGGLCRFPVKWVMSSKKLGGNLGFCLYPQSMGAALAVPPSTDGPLYCRW